MPGHGPPPKPASRRARHDTRDASSTTIEFEPAQQPPLPSTRPKGDPWPDQTSAWWAMWGESPLSTLFSSNDWSELMDTALLHARLWSGDVSAATELRLRVAKFGATPEDRARLRIQFAEADKADAKRLPATSPSRERYADLRTLAG